MRYKAAVVREEGGAFAIEAAGIHKAARLAALGEVPKPEQFLDAAFQGS